MKGTPNESWKTKCLAIDGKSKQVEDNLMLGNDGSPSKSKKAGYLAKDEVKVGHGGLNDRQEGKS